MMAVAALAAVAACSLIKVQMIHRAHGEAVLEYRVYTATKLAESAGYERELELARTVQDSLVAVRESRLGALAFRCVMQRHDAVGGDWFATRTEASGRTIVAVADAAGKGLHAAM